MRDDGGGKGGGGDGSGQFPQQTLAISLFYMNHREGETEKEVGFEEE